MNEHAKRLAPFFGKRCVIEGAETYEGGLYFYVFDATRERALAKAAVEQAIGSWEALEDIGVRSDDVVVFGATVEADLNPQPRPAVAKAVEKHGVAGLLKIGLATPGPLIFDRRNGRAYFFPDGSASTLGKGGTKPRTVTALGIRVVTGESERKLSIGERLETTNNAAIDLLDAGAAPAKIVALVERGLGAMTYAQVRASKLDCPEHFGWLHMKRGEALEQLGRTRDAIAAYELAVGADIDDAAPLLARLKRGGSPRSRTKKSPPAKKEPMPTTQDLLKIGKARVACDRFRDGRGGVAVALDGGSTVVVTAYLADGQDEGAFGRDDRVRLVKIRRVDGHPFLVVAKA